MKKIITCVTAVLLAGTLTAQSNQKPNYQAMIHDAATKAFVNALKSETDEFPVLAEKIKDYDGNLYDVVEIGAQVWMTENLKTTHYRNGNAIPIVEDITAWSNLTKGAYCNHENDENIASTYGCLYNNYAVVDKRKLCPAGWHVPTNAEWIALSEYLGGEQVAGAKLMEIGTAHWNSPNSLATNETGFTALPGGARTNVGGFSPIGNNGLWWSSTETSSSTAWARELLYHNKTYILKASFDKAYGFSVRCIRD